MYKLLAVIFEIGKWIILSTILVLLVHYFVGTIFIVDGESMMPTLKNGSILWVNRLAYLVGKPVRGDMVVIRFPGDPEKRKFIKRVVGEPGERVQVKDGLVYVNNKKLLEYYLPKGIPTVAPVFKDYTLKKDEYFLMGDNRPGSNDSRFFGPVPAEYFIGGTKLIIYPTSIAGYVPQVFYPEEFVVPKQAR